jgi:hypothetical protein
LHPYLVTGNSELATSLDAVASEGTRFVGSVSIEFDDATSPWTW